MSKNTVIQFRGTVYEKGYGMIAQKVMRNKDLPKQSRLIYAYMCSFASMQEDGERSAFPSVSLQCSELCMTEDTYFKWRKPLVEKGYITIEKSKDKGKYERNIYYIEAIPTPNKESVPVSADSSEKEKEKSHDQQNADVKGFSPYPKNSGTDNSGTDNSGTNSINTNSISTNTDDDDYIISEIDKNSCFKSLMIHLSYKNVSKELTLRIIKECIKRNLYEFRTKDFEKQFRHMAIEIDNGVTYTAFEAYFVKGLKDKTEQSFISRQHMQEEKARQEEELQRKLERDTSFYYNWLEG